MSRQYETFLEVFQNLLIIMSMYMDRDIYISIEVASPKYIPNIDVASPKSFIENFLIVMSSLQLTYLYHSQ